MRYKAATTCANLLFMALAASGLYLALHFPEPVVRMTVGPVYFPAAISVALICAALASTVKVWLGTDDHEVHISSPLKVLCTVGAAAAFLFLWAKTGYFYPVSFSVIALFIYGLNPEQRRGRKILTAAALSAAMQVFVYVVFERLMYFRF